MVFGASFWSIYADRRGRKSAFVWSLALVFIAGVLSAASPSLAVLCLCRVVVGFGAGGKKKRDKTRQDARERPAIKRLKPLQSFFETLQQTHFYQGHARKVKAYYSLVLHSTSFWVGRSVVFEATSRAAGPC